MHKLNKTDFDDRRQAREDLKKHHAPIHSVPVLAERVDKLEKATGLTPIIDNIIID